MRWIRPKHKDEKTKTFFALFPVMLNDETRWLEKVTVKYRYSLPLDRWDPVLFVDKEEKK